MRYKPSGPRGESAELLPLVQLDKVRPAAPSYIPEYQCNYMSSDNYPWQAAEDKNSYWQGA